MPKFFLASQSPRRAALLEQIGVPFTQLLPCIDEARAANESPVNYVRRMALEKATAGVALIEPISDGGLSAVLGADTVVVKANRVLGKPADKNEYCSMLNELSGSVHEVLTAVTVVLASRVDKPNGGLLITRECSVLSNTKVTFKPLSMGEVEAYWQTGEPLDKAGGYAIQGVGALFVESLVGSYSGVVGLPLFEIGQLLERLDISTKLHQCTDT